MPPKEASQQLPPVGAGGLTGVVPNTARSGGGSELPPVSARSNATAAAREMQGVAMPTLMLFVFPPHQEHPEALGRLELFARYGPTDELGQLRGGIAGSHGHTDNEIHHMIRESTREAFFKALKKPKSQVEVLVDVLLPDALEENIKKSEIRKLLKNVRKDEYGRMEFDSFQDTVLANQRLRLRSVIKHGAKAKEEKVLKVPFQSKMADALLAITRKKKMNVPEENYAQDKRLHAYSTHLALLQDCKDSADQINLNVSLCRHRGPVSDRWDRYCAVRRSGRSGYVKARNQPKGCTVFDDGLADRHPGVTSLRATSCYQ